MHAYSRTRVMITSKMHALCLVLFACSMLCIPALHAATYYVSTNGDNTVATSWATAKHIIQDAVDMTVDGDLVLVYKGVYDAGGKVIPGQVSTNRVCITNAITVRAPYGPTQTFIVGAESAEGGCGQDSIRCVFMWTDSVLDGFTLTNGFSVGSGTYSYDESGGCANCLVGGMLTNCILTGGTAQWAGGLYKGEAYNCKVIGNTGNRYGGGVRESRLFNCEVIDNKSVYYYGGGALSCMLSNCTISGNSSPQYGGGVHGCTLIDCTLSNNIAATDGGGACGSTLLNCTLVENRAETHGGGASGCRLENCEITENIAYDNGGGVYNCILTNCLLLGNRAGDLGGGSCTGTLNNCTLVGNWVALLGGGSYEGTLNNCIVWDNECYNDPSSSNYYSGTFNYSCTAPMPSVGTENIVADPRFVDRAGEDLQLKVDSPCHNTGNNAYVAPGGGSLDLAGYPRIINGVVDRGAYENHFCSLDIVSAHGAPYPAVGTRTNTFNRGLVCSVGSPVSVGATQWVCYGWTQDGNYPESGLSNRFYMVHTNDSVLTWLWTTNVYLELNALGRGVLTGDDGGWLALGETNVMTAVPNPGFQFLGWQGDVDEGQTNQNPLTFVMDRARHIRAVFSTQIHYVWKDSPNPMAPYTNLQTAAHEIQDAVVRCADGDTILLASGDYDAGMVQASVSGSWNRVCISNAIAVRSIDGPDTTRIIGDHGVRCVLMLTNAVLDGITLTNGLLNEPYPGVGYESLGGGVHCVQGGMLTNCVLSGNSANQGGGAHNATLNDCRLTGNTAGWRGGGVCTGVLNRCVIDKNYAGENGGGAACATLNDCDVNDNTAVFGGGGGREVVAYRCRFYGNVGDYGGGAHESTLNSCVLSENAASHGGGAEDSTLNNCTLSHNTATHDGGGSHQGVLNNCIVYNNTSRLGAPNYTLGRYYGCSLNYCCTTPMPTNGIGNITNNPCLIDHAHIASNSPCMGAGASVYVTGTDIDGDAWLDPPAIGCDQYVVSSITGMLAASISADYTVGVTGYVFSFSARVSGNSLSNEWTSRDNVSYATNTMYACHTWESTGHHDIVFTAYNLDHPWGVSVTQFVDVVSLENATSYVWTNSPSPSAPYANWETAAHTIQDAVDAVTMAGSLIRVTNGVYNTGSVQASGHWQSNRVYVAKPVTIRSENGAAMTSIVGAPDSRMGGIGPRAIRGVYLDQGAILIGFSITNGFTHYSGDPFYDLCGGGVFCVETNAGVLRDCIIKGNSCYVDGAGVFLGVLENCLVINNSANENGGGTYGSSLNNCTLTRNYAGHVGAGAYVCQGAEVKNCVVWENPIGSVHDIYVTETGHVYNTCAAGGIQHGVDGCITNDPLFEGTAHADGHQLLAGSPCYNAGNNDLVSDLLHHDLAGDSRIRFGTVDMGAFERQVEVYRIAVNAGPSGSVVPSSSSIAVESNANVQITMTPDQWYCVEDVLTNGASIGAVSSFTWPAVCANGNLDVSFAAVYVTNSPKPVPARWMARYSLTNNMAQKTGLDPDGDGVSTWREYVMDTDPTNIHSRLVFKEMKLETGRRHRLEWPVSSNRSYALYWTTNLLGGTTNRLFTNYRSATNGIFSYTPELSETNAQIFYRIEVSVP